jgi:hypothetical protein
VRSHEGFGFAGVETGLHPRIVLLELFRCGFSNPDPSRLKHIEGVLQIRIAGLNPCSSSVRTAGTVWRSSSVAASHETASVDA